MATDDDERTVADRVKATELEVPIVRPGDDEEATAVDPPREQLRPQGQVNAVKPTQAEMPKTESRPAHNPSKPPVPDDDDPTQARAPPAYKRKPVPEEPPEDATQTQPPPPPPPPNYYAKGGSRGSTDALKPHKPLHPVVVISIGIAVLFFLLLALNWVRTSHVLEGDPAETRP